MIKLNNKNILRLAPVVLALFTSVSSAQEFKSLEVSSLNSVLKVESSQNRHAQSLGLSNEQYESAKNKYKMLESGELTPSFNSLDEIDAFTNYELYSELELLELLNLHKLKLANFLGLPVDKLDTFVSLVSQNELKIEDGGSDIFKTSDDLEIITVYCSESCRGSSAGASAAFLWVQKAANKAGIPTNTPFTVHFKTRSNVVVAKEIWTHNHWFGARKLKNITKPCSGPNCSYN